MNRLVIALATLLSLPVDSMLADSPNVFVRGDVNQSGSLEISDAVSLLGYLFLGEQALATCLDAADVDGNFRVDISDPLFLLNYLFLGGRQVPRPFPDCDMNFFRPEKQLGCPTYSPCEGEPGEARLYGDIFDTRSSAVYFLLDVTGSMEVTGELGRAKLRMIRALRDLDEDSQFAMFTIESGTKRFPLEGPPLDATPDAVENAVDWLASIRGSSGSCPLAAFDRAFEFLERSNAQNHRMIYIGDGGGVCGGASERRYLEAMVERVTETNAGRAIIHAIGILMRPEGIQRGYLQSLVEQNGGRYIER
ncbi:MAG: hypothetical protein AAF517_25540 [Planctomycetota bacterium]